MTSEIQKLADGTSEIATVPKNTKRDGATPVSVDHERVHNTLPMAMYTTDVDGRITYFNKAAAELWGRVPEIGKEFWCGSWKLYWPDGTLLPHDKCPMAQTLATGKAIRGVEALLEQPNGTLVSIIPYPTPLFDDAGRLIGAVNVFVEVGNRGHADSANQRLAAIVGSSEDAIISLTVTGIITTWNESAERLFGYSAEEVIGKSIEMLIPQDRLSEEAESVERLRQGQRGRPFETVRRRKDGSLIDISLTVSPIKDGQGNVVGASKTARDISDRKRAEKELRLQAKDLENLNQMVEVLSRDLDMERIVQVVTDTATSLSGAKFGAFFYNVKNAQGDSYALYTLSGAERADFEKFGMPRNTAVFDPTFQGQGVVRSDNILKDPRYGQSAPHFGMPKGHLPVVSYLAVPVKSRTGEVLGGLFFAHDQSGMFDQEAENLVLAIARHAALAFENARLHTQAQIEIQQRKTAEAEKALLLEEIKHRVKNSLSTVLVLAKQSFRNAPHDEYNAFNERVRALADVQDLLTQRGGGHIAVKTVIERALAPFDENPKRRFKIDGPEFQLPAEKSLAISMALHELATNATKYGALSNDKGCVGISWNREAPHRVRFCWAERNGPRVTPPTTQGFGTALLSRTFGSAVKVDYLPDGVVCTIDIPEDGPSSSH